MKQPDYSKLTTKEIAKEYTKLRDIAHKRLARARKAGLEKFSSLYSEPMKISDMPKDETARRKALIMHMEELRKPLTHGYTKLVHLRVHQAKKRAELSKKFKRNISLEETTQYMTVLGRMWDALTAMNLPSEIVKDAIEDAGYPPDFDKILDSLLDYAKGMESDAEDELQRLRKTVDRGKF